MFFLLPTLLFFMGCLMAAAAKEGRPIDQIEHVILFMQENRPFDHYFGKLQGVRGFNDRTTVPLRSGFNAFHQPIDQDNLDEYMLPFRADANRTNAMCMPAPTMYYPTDIEMWNSGRMDAWNTARDPGMGMSYFTREDLPYYYELYDNFLTADHYYQSTFTATNPNRMHFFSGSNGLSVGEAAVLENDEPRPGFNWTTMAELLEEKNISWRVYQQIDNFDDNAFAWFNSFQKSRPGDALFDKGMARQQSIMETFQEDLEAGTLPTVSWIIAPQRKSEHATNHPCAGEDFTARLLAILKDFPDTYAKSAFVLNYDEGGQFYDHAWTPTPPLDPSEGISTVTVDGEINTEVLTDVPAPIGLGYRVPLLLISPWTRGNLLLSEALDHISVIKFLEVRFNIECPNISPWRRAITGDLTNAFDFENPDYSWPQDLPDTSDYVEEGDVQCHTLPPPEIPELQSMPQQEPGTRISRALPYEFNVRSSISTTTAATTTTTTAAAADSGGGTFQVTVQNTGAGGAPFVLYDVTHLETENPRQYAVESNKEITDTRALQDYDAETGQYSYSYALMGINGFARIFQGSTADVCATTHTVDFSSVEAFLSYAAEKDEVVLTISIASDAANHDQNKNQDKVIELQLIDNAYNLLLQDTTADLKKKDGVSSDASSDKIPLRISSAPGTVLQHRINTAASGNWYDFTVSADGNSNSSSCFLRRFMGHMENGRDSISDPAMAAGVPGLWTSGKEGQHPKLPEHLRRMKRVEGEDAAYNNKDARFFTPVGGSDGEL